MGTGKASSILNNEYSEAIEEAQILLAHASREGLDVNEETIDIIVNAAKEENWTAEIEIKFWMAFKSLSKLVKPVSVESLKAIKNPFGKDNSILSKIFKNRIPKSSATRTVRLYKFMVLITILLLLFVQIYWLIGSEVRENILNLQKELSSLRDETVKKSSVNQKNIGKREATTTSTEPSTVDPRVMEIGALIEVELDILHSWNKVWKFVTFSYSSSTKFPKEFLSAVKEPQKIVEIAQFPLKVIQEYLLPLLYGLLGALTYVLRSIVLEIKNLTFTNESRINYGMRILLGMLAGFAITWFFSNSDSTKVLSLKTLSPMALSFLAGYSVELLFSAMDNIISAFTRKKSSETRVET